MFWGEDILEAVGVPRQECVRLFRDVSGMIVQNNSDGAFRRILGIEVGQQADELDAAMTVFHARRDMTIVQIQRRENGTCPQSFIFVVARHRRVLAGYGRQVRRGIRYGLQAGLFIHRDSDHGQWSIGRTAPFILQRNLLIYGVGGIVVPFIGIKLIDMLITAVGLA